MNSRERLIRNFDDMANITAPGKGINRLAFTDADWEGRDYIIRLMKDAGLEVETDGFGNVIGYREGLDNSLPVVMVGSHTDSVPEGGNYDGVVGVLSAIESIRRMNDEGFQNEHPIAVVSFMCEESSRFGSATLGSKAMRGELTASDLKRLRDKEGFTLYDVLASRQLTPESPENIRYTKPVKSFLEMHIEQGKVLEHAGLQIGIVTGIAAPERLRVILRGHADHSGATPMELRNDALCAAAETVLLVERAAKEQTDSPVVGTVGVLDVVPGAMNVIPGQVVMGVDIRSLSEEARDVTVRRIRQGIEEITGRRGIAYDIECIANDHPVAMHPKMMDIIESAAKEQGLTCQRMPSGAGHDAMHWAQEVPTGMIFIPCKDGVSHNPAEYADMADILAGTELMDRVLRRLSQKDVSVCNYQ